MKLRSSVFDIVKNFMSLLNETFTDHGIRVAYIYLVMSEFDGMISVEALHKLLFLCMFHDIGAYKTEEIDDLLKFEVSNTLSHSVYGYLFIKHFSPLSDYAPVILYHHLHYDQRDKCRLKLRNFAMRLNLADRTDICAVNENDDRAVISHIVERSGTTFDPYDVKLLLEADKKHDVIGALRSGRYVDIVRDYYNNYVYKDEMLDELIMMLSMTIDFKNEETVAHSIQTSQFAKMLGLCCGINDREGLDDLYYAGLLHDMGKIKLPDDLLKNDSLPTEEERAVMRKHAQYTKEIISDIFEGDIVDIASRHHEAPNGLGYPCGLTSADLTLPQKILPVADITSLLLGGSSIRTESMPKDDMRVIMGAMAERGQLDRKVVETLFDNYDKIRQGASADTLRVLERYEAMKREYSVCIRKYSALDNTFYRDNKLFADFCAISKQEIRRAKPEFECVKPLCKKNTA